MGKIRVSDLATKMGLPSQDLVFKLKSIGVRIESEEAEIDSDVIQAILTGKSLHQPKEVILRDGTAAEKKPKPRRTPPRRMPPGPQRPRGRRPMIHRVEPRIKTIPSRQKPPEEAAAEASQEATADAAEVAVEETAAATSEPVVEATQTAEVTPDEATAEDLEPTKEGGPITLAEGMTVRDFAEKLDVKAKDLMSKLMARGMMPRINQVLDLDLAEELAAEFGREALQVSFEEEVQIQEEAEREADTDQSIVKVPRAPVVTVMGHVDHGKTSLLDNIRSARVAAGEAGGITQHIAAYQVEVKGKKIVFLDTPGHEAFTKLRARGAQVTDIVILMVAADDGVMAQTVEAIQHARATKVPIVVAINKVDKANANVDRVKQGLADQELLVEDWGGDTVAVPISALKGEGIDQLLEMLLLTADILELEADPEVAAQGTVIEARKERGRGNVATILVQSGTLRQGDITVVGSAWGRVRSMENDLGERIQEAGPSTPVEVTGFGDLPEAGDRLQVVDSESKARQIVSFRQEEDREREMAAGQGTMSLEQFFSRVAEGETAELTLVIKADMQGSLEVLRDTLVDLSTDKVKVNIALAGVGAITTNDIAFAAASEAIVIGFSVRPEKAAADLARKEGVDIRTHTVIYEITEEITQAMTGLLQPTFKTVDLGRAEVRELFKVPKIGSIAGCHVVEGVIGRNNAARLVRDNVVVYEGKISSLRRFKDDASEVRAGFDCGIGLDRFQDVKPGDFIEVYEQQEVAGVL